MGDTLCTKLQGGDWASLLISYLNPFEIIELAKLPPTSLLSAITLRQAVGPVRCNELIKQSKVIPEIDHRGNRRCVYIQKNGNRCMKYSPSVVCPPHGKRAAELSAYFKSPKLKDAYNKFLTDPRKQNLNSEVAMLRTMLAAVAGNIKEGYIPIETLATVTLMCKSIGDLVEKMNKLTAITPEVVDNLLKGVVEIMSQYITDPLKLQEAADQIAQLDPMAVEATIPYEPGNVVELQSQNGEATEAVVIETHKELDLDMQKRALADIATQLDEEDEM